MRFSTVEITDVMKVVGSIQKASGLENVDYFHGSLELNDEREIPIVAVGKCLGVNRTQIEYVVAVSDAQYRHILEGKQFEIQGVTPEIMERVRQELGRR